MQSKIQLPKICLSVFCILILAGSITTVIIWQVSPIPVSAQAPDKLNLNGVWKTNEPGGSEVISLSQQGQSVQSAVHVDECTSGPRTYYIRGELQVASLTGSIQHCTDAESTLVTDCGLEPLWETTFKATITPDEIAGQHEISGEYKAEWWTYDVDDNGKLINCKLDYNYQEKFSLHRVDCTVLTFEQLAAKYPDRANELDLAKRFEKKESLVWSDQQKAPGGLKERAEAFQKQLDFWGFRGSTINSAYRPLLYQAHFADLRQCALKLLGLLSDSPDLATHLRDSIKKINDEVGPPPLGHGIEHEVHTAGGVKVKVPFVCYREPLTNCPHVGERAVDMSIISGPETLEDVDRVGAMVGLCRPYPVKDKPHWELVGNPKCTQFVPGNAEIQISGNSPINILVQDSTGRRIGFDPLTGSEVNDFGESSALYSGADSHPQIINILSDVTLPGAYNVTGVGAADGEYTITINIVNEAGVLVHSQNSTGQASSGQPISPVSYTMLKDYLPDPLWNIGNATLLPDGNTSFTVNAEGRIFNIEVIGNGISSLMFIRKGHAISFENDRTEGALKVVIPKELLDGKFTVRSNGHQIGYNTSETQTTSALIFNKPGNSTIITLQGTTVVPELLDQEAVVNESSTSNTSKNSTFSEQTVAMDPVSIVDQ